MSNSLTEPETSIYPDRRLIPTSLPDAPVITSENKKSIKIKSRKQQFPLTPAVWK